MPSSPTNVAATLSSLPMDSEALTGILDFLRAAERLKNETRSSWTSEGRRERVAEHTWRLCLTSLAFEQHFPELDDARLAKMCVVHDLGEFIGGAIPAVEQPADPPIAPFRRILDRGTARRAKENVPSPKDVSVTTLVG